MEHGSDICQCGDFRSQHENGSGRCRVCFGNNAPYDRCGRFQFAHVASDGDRATWNQYHSARAMKPARSAKGCRPV